MKDYELLNNTLCKTILQNAKSNISYEFTLQELGDVLKELKRGKCMDPAGFIREMFINGRHADPVIISHGQFYQE